MGIEGHGAESSRSEESMVGTEAKPEADMAALRDDLLAAQTENDLHGAITQQDEALSALTNVVAGLSDLCSELRHQLGEVHQQVRRHGDETLSILYGLRSEPLGAATVPTPTPEGLRYRQAVQRIREIVRTEVPPGATVIVVSKGDEELVRLYGRPAWHFPRNSDGRYAGYYPRSGTAAVVHLEALRAAGGDYFLVPASGLWWLDHYAELREHLMTNYRQVLRMDDTCVLFSLRERPAGEYQAMVGEELRRAVGSFEERFGDDPSVLDWDTGEAVHKILPGYRVFAAPIRIAQLPYLDDTVDIVTVATNDPDRLAEAARVARVAVVNLDEGDDRPTRIYGRSHRSSTRWLMESESRSMPSASVIIPCFNGLAHTRACLESLDQTLSPGSDVEIVVVDDASTDGTWRWLQDRRETDARLKLIRNPQNMGFLSSINRGARAASGDVLVLLNNDTVALPGWLAPLLRTFQIHPDAGAVGGKLVFPDGRLQEAGGIVFRDGTAAKLGYLDVDLTAPLYSFVRPVDYCSAALLATPRAVFDEFGGFDEAYMPAYYEDTDYCFRLGQRDRRVYYQPESVVIHSEGATAGNDVLSGMKQYQVANHARFVRRWDHVLRDRPPRPSEPFDTATLYRLVTTPPARWVITL